MSIKKQNDADKKPTAWLLFFYSVPSKPVSSRMKVWRKLIKVGAVQLKGSVYILPDNDEHYEFLQWLVTEISGMKGEGAFARIDKIETMKPAEIIALFNEHRGSDYRDIGKSLDDLERRLGSIQKGTKAQNIKVISEQFDKLVKEYDGIATVDFFQASEGARLREKIENLKSQINSLSGAETKKESPILTREIVNYQGRLWVTRKKPFIDRMASAWLIRKFIDRKAAFGFIDEKEIDTLGKNSSSFDIRGGEFTHSGDMCTFEVLIRAFELKDKILRKMAEIIHDLDMRDDKYKAAEARGLEDILSGIRKSAKDDTEALEKGMAVFEMVYVSKSR
jgi:hypothetical protein